MTKRKDLIKRDYTDPSGITRRVLISEGESDPSIGIPVSLDLTPLYSHMPADFQQALYMALHAQGLVEPADYFKPGASDAFKRAMISVIRHDFFSAQRIAKEELNHNG